MPIKWQKSFLDMSVIDFDYVILHCNVNMPMHSKDNFIHFIFWQNFLIGLNKRFGLSAITRCESSVFLSFLKLFSFIL